MLILETDFAGATENGKRQHFFLPPAGAAPIQGASAIAAASSIRPLTRERHKICVSVIGFS
jgi:hypothetical protein